MPMEVFEAVRRAVYSADDVDAKLALLATKTELGSAVAPLATSVDLTNAVRPLATKAEVTAAVQPLATKTAMTAAIKAATDPLAPLSALSPLATKTETTAAIASAVSAAVAPLASKADVETAKQAATMRRVLKMELKKEAQADPARFNQPGAVDEWISKRLRVERVSAGASKVINPILPPPGAINTRKLSDILAQ